MVLAWTSLFKYASIRASPSFENPDSLGLLAVTGPPASATGTAARRTIVAAKFLKLANAFIVSLLPSVASFITCRPGPCQQAFASLDLDYPIATSAAARMLSGTPIAFAPQKTN